MIKNKNNINEDTNNLFINNKSNTTSFSLQKTYRTKSLIDEVNDYLKVMKKGKNFDKIINSQGRTKSYLLTLSQDEKKIYMSYKGCCLFRNKINIEEISSCEIGHSNNFYSSKKFENFFTIELIDNKSHEFYNKSQLEIKNWVNCINYLIQKNIISNEKPDNKILSKDEISNIWKDEVIPNWTIYRKYLLDKNKQNYFTKKVETNKKKMNKYNNSKDNINILQSNHQEILYLWSLGLPNWLRKYLWSIIIGNKLEISEKLFQGYSKQIFKESGNNDTNFKKILDKSLVKNSLINNLNYDIEFYYQKYNETIISENKLNFKNDIYLIVHSFCNYRLDVLYSKEITDITSFLYLNSDNNYETFRILCNFIVQSYLFDFIQNDISVIKNYYEFFEKLVQKYTPLLYNYIQTLNISLFFAFYKWTKNLFLKIFPYETCLIIFDNFIIKGKILIFQIALAILIINQNMLIHFDIGELKLFFKKTKLNIEANTLFDEIDKLDIRKEYEDFFDNYALGKEKIELFQDL